VEQSANHLASASDTPSAHIVHIANVASAEGSRLFVVPGCLAGYLFGVEDVVLCLIVFDRGGFDGCAWHGVIEL
jgi:hypothetical protein